MISFCFFFVDKYSLFYGCVLCRYFWDWYIVEILIERGFYYGGFDIFVGEGIFGMYGL